jgi:hypothetical protein
MKTYNFVMIPEHRRGIVANLITLMYKRMHGKMPVGGIVPAPPRLMLHSFGGNMTVEEFRRSSNEGHIYTCLPPRMIPHQYVFEKHSTESNRLKVSKPVEEVVGMKNGLMSTGAACSRGTDSLRLRRHKPLAGDKDVLRQAFGFN